MYYVALAMKKQRFIFEKSYPVGPGPQIKLSIPIELLRDIWRLDEGDRVVASVENKVYTVRPMK